jgi:hypothetical protein
MSTSESREQFARIWGYHITAVNPQQDQGADEANPLSLDPFETGVTWEWLNRIVNRCQRHRCSTAYCLRLTKRDAQRAREAEARTDTGEAAGEAAREDQPPLEPTCRFLFPRPQRAVAEVVKRPGKTW